MTDSSKKSPPTSRRSARTTKRQQNAKLPAQTEETEALFYVIASCADEAGRFAAKLPLGEGALIAGAVASLGGHLSQLRNFPSVIFPSHVFAECAELATIHPPDAPTRSTTMQYGFAVTLLAHWFGGHYARVMLGAANELVRRESIESP